MSLNKGRNLGSKGTEAGTGELNGSAAVGRRGLLSGLGAFLGGLTTARADELPDGEPRRFPSPALGSRAIAVNDFPGCDPTGRTPSDAAFKAWIEALNASPRGVEARIASGIYRLTMAAGPYILRRGGCNIRGAGRGNTLLVIDNESSNLFELRSGMNTIADLQITHRDPTSQGKSGVAIGCALDRQASFNTIRDLTIDHVHKAIGVVGALKSGVWSVGVEVTNIRAVANVRGLDLTAALNWSIRDSVFQMRDASAGTAAIEFGASSEGCFLNAVQALSGEYAMLFSNVASGGVPPKDHDLVSCVGDGGGVSASAWLVKSGRRIKMTSCWASCQNPKTRLAAVHFQGSGDDRDVYGAEWNQGSIENVAGRCLAIENGASGILVANSRFANWSLSGQHEAVSLSPGSTPHVSALVVNNRFVADADFRQTAPEVAIRVRPGIYDRYIIAGNLNENSTVRQIVDDQGQPRHGKSVSGNL